jgi:5'-nucleotidase
MDGGRNQGLGGVAARAAQIESIRNTNEQVLLLDAGDIFQGTPYFNIYNGEPEIKAMTAMKYDACTMGNHDFDAGIENFALQMQKASFPCIISNYDFTNTPLEGKTIPYRVIKKGSLKIGIFGLGIKLKGLVPDNLSGNTIYLDPIEKANEMAAFLKKEKKCDLIICLSHLGYKYRETNQISDVILASETLNIDLIIGGHTHTFLDEPTIIWDKAWEEVIINQVGWAGIRLGRLDFEFNGIRKKNLIKSHTIVISKKTSN